MRHLSAFVLDRYELDKLSADERAQVEAHLADCARCRAEREAAAQARRRFTEHVLPRTLERVTERRHRRWWRWTPMLLVPATALAALLLLLRPPMARLPLAEPDYAYKGGPSLTVYARHGDRVSVLHDGQTVQPGDELRFVVVAAGQRYLLVTSLDGAGQASVYYPFGAERSAAVGPERTELPGSVTRRWATSSCTRCSPPSRSRRRPCCKSSRATAPSPPSCT
jgi:anti-sigma factor RsiW